jgi:trimethylamine--corrinoid protein Co-methyltransferase
VNPKTLAGDVIRHAGPGGNFISARHTRRYFHKEHFVPPLTNRERREVWDQQGRKTIAERAHEKVQSILNDTPTYYLDDTLRTRLLEKYPNIQR